ncbi:MAG: hypothetical protein KDJ99_30345 [Candidatus Competibacteraceae bacterium]|nr:hypothetical protein [Candidatus Competibacteraceae bacterium]
MTSEQEQITLIKHLIYGPYARYSDADRSLHGIISRILLLLGKQVAVAIVAWNDRKVIAHTVHDHDLESIFFDKIKQVTKSDARLEQHTIKIPIIDRGDTDPPKQYGIILATLEKDEETHKRYEILATSSKDSQLVQTLFERIAQDAYAKHLLESQFITHAEKHFHSEQIKFLAKRAEDYLQNKRVLSEDNPNLIEQYIQSLHELLSRLYEDIKDAPLLRNPHHPIPNLLFALRSATGTREIGEGITLPYEVRLLIPPSQEQGIRSHYKKIIPEPATECSMCKEGQETCCFAQEAAGCLFTRDLDLGDLAEQSLTKLAKTNPDAALDQFIGFLKTPYGNFRAILDGIFLNGVVSFSENIADDARLNVFTEQNINNPSYRRYLFTQCLFQQMAQDPRPGAFMAPLRVANTTLMAAMFPLDSTNEEVAAQEKEKAQQQRWLDCYHYYVDIVSRHFARKMRAQTRDSYLRAIADIVAGTLENVGEYERPPENSPTSDVSLYCKNIVTCFNQINTGLLALCQIHPYDRVYLLLCDKSKTLEEAESKIKKESNIYRSPASPSQGKHQAERPDILNFFGTNVFIILSENSHFQRHSLRHESYYLDAVRVKAALVNMLDNFLLKLERKYYPLH